MPAFTTKPLAPWRLLARGSLLAWTGQSLGGASARDSRRSSTAGPAGHPALAGLGAEPGGRGAARGAGGGRRRHPGSASWRRRGGARPGGQEARAGIAQLRETLSRPAVRAPAAWRGLEVKGGDAGGEGAEPTGVIG